MPRNRPFNPSRVIRALLLTVGTGLALGGCASGGSDSGVVADLLDGLSPPTPGQAARDAFNVYDADKRRQALALLTGASFGGEAPYLRLYRLLIDDPDATVRGAAVKALGMHGTVEDAQLIVARLTDETAFVRWEAAKALQRIHNPVAAQPLIDVLRDDPDGDVRMAAADALGQYAQRPVFDTLVGALTDTNYGVVNAATNSLRTLTGYAGDADPLIWLVWSEQHRGELFANQRQYAYQAYQKPPGLWQKMLPGDDDRPAPRLAPIGLQAGDAATSG